MNHRDNLKKIYTSAIESVNPKNAVISHMKRDGSIINLLSGKKVYKKFDLKNYEKIYVVGAGKATSPMAAAIEEILGDEIYKGSICVKYGYTTNLTKIETTEASHPIPDENGVKGAKKIRELLHEAGENDLIISLISGGGSALLPLPPDPITLEEKQQTTNLLLKSGATIHEINAVRKHLSMVKGGNLAGTAYPATVINLMISDVVGDNIDVIASGPFVPDNSKFSAAMKILESYGLAESVPASVIDHIKSGVNKEIDENPDEKSRVFNKITNLVIASNIIALEASREKAVELGYNSIILSSLIEGDTKDTAIWHTQIAREIMESSNPVSTPACIISGGETTVKVSGEGLGGRNMEFAMQASTLISGLESITVASVGTDGTDGPTDAAGALADGMTLKRAGEQGLDVNSYIENNDSYNFFKEIGDLIITGPTNTNVMDVRILIVGNTT